LAEVNGQLTRLEQKIWRGLMPPSCGVYLLMSNKEIVYVGASRNIRRRVLEHHQNGRPFDYVYAVATKEGEEINLERQLIMAIRPSQNRAGVPASSWDGAF
jgi:excinuclease UvrABC nuclease subunit